jgi:hypothetical protein
VEVLQLLLALEVALEVLLVVEQEELMLDHQGLSILVVVEVEVVQVVAAQEEQD